MPSIFIQVCIQTSLPPHFPTAQPPQAQAELFGAALLVPSDATLPPSRIARLHPTEEQCTLIRNVHLFSTTTHSRTVPHPPTVVESACGMVVLHLSPHVSLQIVPQETLVLQWNLMEVDLLPSPPVTSRTAAQHHLLVELLPLVIPSHSPSPVAGLSHAGHPAAVVGLSTSVPRVLLTLIVVCSHLAKHPLPVVPFIFTAYRTHQPLKTVASPLALPIMEEPSI